MVIPAPSDKHFTAGFRWAVVQLSSLKRSVSRTRPETMTVSPSAITVSAVAQVKSCPRRLIATTVTRYLGNPDSGCVHSVGALSNTTTLDIQGYQNWFRHSHLLQARRDAPPSKGNSSQGVRPVHPLAATEHLCQAVLMTTGKADTASIA